MYAGTNAVSKIRAKKIDEEPGAYNLYITGGTYRKAPFKWFYGEKIRPAATRVRFDAKTYKKACELIEEAAETGKEAIWEAKQIEERHCRHSKAICKGAYAHEMRNKRASK